MKDKWGRHNYDRRKDRSEERRRAENSRIKVCWSRGTMVKDTQYIY